MKVNGRPYRSIWLHENGWSVDIIDQTRLPHEFIIKSLNSMQDAAEAISVMRVRGAPLIGATAAYGMALAMREDAGDDNLARAAETLLATRPTAVNLRWALDRMLDVLSATLLSERVVAAYALAAEVCDEDVQINHAIGQHALSVIQTLWQQKPAGSTSFNILTHCNAGWLATVDWGTALSAIYQAYDDGIPVHVWVDETRPRNQGAALTAWELQSHGIPHDVI
ncbi:MAG: S-methyl-5-thioribose-1-phosphate isomerase, partial [Xanthomonadales bacterium]|nr:S-methyl-5-thioribose-1-phosphate isomerase [Xanthomonadales bacterium]